jgi:hypothetical protein
MRFNELQLQTLHHPVPARAQRRLYFEAARRTQTLGTLLQRVKQHADARKNAIGADIKFNSDVTLAASLQRLQE